MPFEKQYFPKTQEIIQNQKESNSYIEAEGNKDQPPSNERDVEYKESDSVYSFDVDLEDDPSEEGSVIYQNGF